MADNPHHRDKISFQGDRSARYLEKIDVPYLTHLLPDGTVAKKKVGGTFVTMSGQEDTASFALGRIGGASRIIGAPAPEGPYRDRGPAPQFRPGYTVSVLSNFGRGYGYTYEFGDATYYTDVHGYLGSFREVSIVQTRDGRALDTYLKCFVTNPNGTGYMQLSVSPAGYRMVGGKPTFHRGVAFVTVNGLGQFVPEYIMDDGRGGMRYGDPVRNLSQRCWKSDVFPLAPGVLLRLDYYVREPYPDFGYDTFACKPYVMSISHDGGATWSDCGLGDIFTDEANSLRELSRLYTRTFNDCVGDTQLSVAPLSRTQAVFLAVAPYSINLPGKDPVIQAKVKLGTIDINGGSTTNQVLFEGSTWIAGGIAGRGVLATDQGAIAMLRQQDSEGSTTSLPAKLHRTTDGASLVEYATMPKLEMHTGSPSMADRKIMLCTMYDGGGTYSLYKSKDFGVSWGRSAILTANGTEPHPTWDRFSMPDFEAITTLRRNGVSTNTTPGVPWLTDCRVPHN